MRFYAIGILISLSLSVQIFAEEKLQEMVDNTCGTCHLTGKVSKEKLNRMAAPPMWGVAKKIKVNIQNKQEQIKFMIDFVLNPNPKKMLFPQETIDRFGYMPSQKDIISKKDLQTIAEYLLTKRY